MAASDIALYSRCANFTLSHAESALEHIHIEMQTSSRNSLLEGLGMLRVQKIILAVGMLSLFESLLQEYMQWPEPFARLNGYLKECKQNELAQKLSDYRLAINVLKHGRGRSYEQLLARRAKLEFDIKSEGESFFFEGDVSEVVGTLIDVNDRFVKRCAELIEEASAVIRSKEPSCVGII